ncbi:Crp/Fnr family transcriptional regulator [Spirochaetia bacterium 38H-sp]|uniref:Crp/Fnr family transcriptional regulator n=1 Tax=Rarispira pelagica TaxID=3141764 RepID=A0ABU9U8K6_9SPIR
MQKNTIQEQLARTPLFANLTEKELATIFTRTIPQITKLNPGKTLIHQGAEYTQLWILLSGTAEGRITDYSGKTVTVENFSSPCIIAPAILFSKNPILPVELIATDTGRAAIIRKEELINIFTQHPTVMENFLADVSEKLITLSSRLSFVLFLNIRQKLARYLLAMPHTENRIKLPLSISALAEYFGTSRPSLSRELSILTKKGIIKKEGKYITILDRKALKKELDRTGRD